MRLFQFSLIKNISYYLKFWSLGPLVRLGGILFGFFTTRLALLAQVSRQFLGVCDQVCVHQQLGVQTSVRESLQPAQSDHFFVASAFIAVIYKRIYFLVMLTGQIRLRVEHNTARAAHVHAQERAVYLHTVQIFQQSNLLVLLGLILLISGHGEGQTCLLSLDFLLTRRNVLNRNWFTSLRVESLARQEVHFS